MEIKLLIYCFHLLKVDGATSADETLIAEINLFDYNQPRALEILFFLLKWF